MSTSPTPSRGEPLSRLGRKPLRSPQTRVCEETACRKAFAGRGPARWCPECRRSHRGRPALKYQWTPEKDAILRERYDGRWGTAPGIARQFGWPTGVIHARASDLGLTRLHLPKRRWTKQEEAFLEEHAGARTVRSMARELGRGVAAIAWKLRDMEISGAVRDDTYTNGSLALCFGVSKEMVRRWVMAGYFGKVGSRYSEGGPALPGDWTSITAAQVRAFIRRHPTRFRLSRVDQLWFLDLVFEGRIAATVSEAVE